MSVSGPSVLGQLLIVKLDESRWSRALERMLERYQPAGIFLSRLRSPESAAAFVARVTRTLDAPPLLWLEAEGGGSALNAFLPPLPSPRSAAERGPSAVERQGELVGATMRLLGFNTNCAPTLDLAPRDESGNRATTLTFGSDPRCVARAGAAFVQGLTKLRILACAKYFPGASTAEGRPPAEHDLVAKSMTRLWHEDLVPYRRVLAHLPFVMVSNAAYKAYDFDILRPAAESTGILRGLLRLKLRYAGLAVADLTRTPESGDALELANRVVRSISAGCDLAIISGDEKGVAAALATLESASQSGKLGAGRIDETSARLRHATKRLPRPAGRVSQGEVERLAREFEEFSRSIAVDAADVGATSFGRRR